MTKFNAFKKPFQKVWVDFRGWLEFLTFSRRYISH